MKDRGNIYKRCVNKAVKMPTIGQNKNTNLSKISFKILVSLTCIQQNIKFLLLDNSIFNAIYEYNINFRTTMPSIS